MLFSPETIRERVKKQPFVPLRITTSAGEHFDVLHPELIFIGTRDIQVGKPSKKHPAIYDRVDRIALLHITAIKDLELPAASEKSGSNGQQ